MSVDYAERSALRVAERWVRDAHLPEDICWLSQSRMVFSAAVARGSLNPAPARFDHDDPVHIKLVYMIAAVKAHHPEMATGAWLNHRGDPCLSITLPTVMVLLFHRDDHGPRRPVSA